MTAQFTDTVIYQDVSYGIIGVKGEGLPTPQDFDMKPVMMTTACYRGYVAGYTCLHDKLVLTRMKVRVAGDYQPIDGVLPEVNRDSISGGLYTGLHLATAFTGRLLIAKDFIQEMYVHMGFQKPSSYRSVIELFIEAGTIVNVFDHSRAMTRLRQQMEEHRQKLRESVEETPEFLDPVRIDRRQIEAWIKDAFSLDYDPDMWNW